MTFSTKFLKVSVLLATAALFASCGRHSSIETQSVGLLTTSELLATAPQTAVSPANMANLDEAPSVATTTELASSSVDQPTESKASATTPPAKMPFASAKATNSKIAPAKANNCTKQSIYSKVTKSDRYHFTNGDSGDDMSPVKLCCTVILIIVALSIAITGLGWIFSGLLGITTGLGAVGVALGLLGIILFLGGGYLAYYLIKRTWGE